MHEQRIATFHPRGPGRRTGIANTDMAIA